MMLSRRNICLGPFLLLLFFPSASRPVVFLVMNERAGQQDTWFGGKGKLPSIELDS